MRKMMIPKKQSHSGMEIKVWSKVWVKLLYLLTILFLMFFLIDSLDYNLLSISQLCKMGYNCLFTDISVTVFRRSNDLVAFKGVLNGQLYLVDFNDNNVELDNCLTAKTNMGSLWHRRLAHIGDVHKGVTTRSRVAHFCEHYSFVSSIEPYRIEDALRDPDWMVAMQE
jgi:hypothetical protein